MGFNYTIKDSLPPLSWLAIINKDNEIVTVFAGHSVEVKDDFFVSGVWDGEFEKGDFDNCNFSCCTGAKFKDGKVIFLTPHHLNACIFLIKKEDSIILSNSASFLLGYTNENLDPNYYNYDSDFCCETLGKRNMKPPYHSYAPLLDKKQLNIYSYCKILIDKSLNVVLERRHTDFHFKNFEDYRNALTVTLNDILKNIRSENRKCNYGMIATISKGYDAPTCATLAKEIGCNEVFTFNRPDHYKNDCGTEIAKILGYDVIHECDGDFVKKNTDFIEAADFASGDSGVMITFEGQKHLFENKLLFCGFCGDEFWGIDHLPYKDLVYPIEGSNSNSYEVFLQSNTIMILIPYIGADHAQEIYDISRSEEMKPWRLGVKYDRPICRRIVEDAGVERGMFGQNKVGSGFCFHYDTLRSIEKKLSPQSYRSLLVFSKSMRQNLFKKAKAYGRFFYYNIPIYLPYVLNKFHIKISMKPWIKEHLSNPVSTTYILWGVDFMKKKYVEALKK